MTDADHVAGGRAGLPSVELPHDAHPPSRTPEAAANPTRTFASLRYLQYRHLFTVGVLMFIAVQAQQIARGQLAFELTGSNAGLGGVYLGFGVPMLLITPVGGVVADRFPKRTVLLCAQVCLVASAAWIAIAGALGVVEYWMLVGAAVLQGAGFAVLGPTRVAFTAELVPKHLLGNAVAVTQMSLNSTRVFAPAVAGALIAIRSIGTTGVYVVTTVVMTFSLIVAYRLPQTARRSRDSTRSVAGELTDGMRYARRDPLLKLLILSSFVMVMTAWPYLAFLPAVANDMHDAGTSGLGLLSAVSAVAALAVTIWIAGRTRPNHAWRIQSICGVVLAIGLLGVAASPNFALCLVALFVIGGAASGYQSMNNTIVLIISDLEYHGRVQSLLMLSFAGFGLAALPLGLLADAVGLRTTFAAMGSVCLVTMACYALAQRRVRRRGGNLDLETAPG